MRRDRRPGGIVISAGFAELHTDEGRQRQAELKQLAAETGLRMIGPNNLGAANLAGNVWATASSRIVAAPTLARRRRVRWSRRAARRRSGRSWPWRATVA